MDEQSVEAANGAQAREQAAARANGEQANYTGVLARQAYGPLPKMLIPLEHSRKSRYPLFNDALKSSDSALGVDFDCLEALIFAAQDVEALEEIPPDFLRSEP